MFRSFQIIIREFRRSLLKLLRIHDLVRFCELRGLRRTPSQLHSLQHIPTQHDMLLQHLVYKNELNSEHVINLARNDEIP